MKKILIVDDEAINLDLLSEVMERFGKVTGVSTGLQALGELKEAYDEGQPFDLVCLDLMLPGLDGQQTLQELRRLEEKRGVAPEKQVKVIIVSALADDQNISDAYLKGRCHAYLRKPFNLRQIESKLLELGLLTAKVA